MPEHWWGHVVVDLGRQVCPFEVAPAAAIAGPVEQGGMDVQHAFRTAVLLVVGNAWLWEKQLP
jgi:hypothetical protein